MNILIVTETLETGGAETFVIRLANALVEDNQVTLVNIHSDRVKLSLLESLSPKVKYQPLKTPLKRFLQFLDSVFSKMGLSYRLLDTAIIGALKDVVSKVKPDVIHSHLLNPDYYVAQVKAGSNFPFKFVATNHGDYMIQSDNKHVRSLGSRKVKYIFKHLDCMVNISDEQTGYIHSLNEKMKTDVLSVKILNGYSTQEVIQVQRDDLKIPFNAFVFGMVARGIREKGWAELIDAFLIANLPGAKLVLVGEGEFLNKLSVSYRNEQNIIFAGFSSTPMSLIRIFDVGVLPSYYKAESLPTVIIEYLHCGKPVIATKVGEVEAMLKSDDSCYAGEVIDLVNGGVDVQKLADVMVSLFNDRARMKALKACTERAAEKFDMTNCLNRYLSVYKK